MANELIYSEIQTTEIAPATYENGASANPTPGQSASEHTALFPPEDSAEFRDRWREIQGAFVDEPRRAVEQANALVGHVSQRLTDVFNNERAKLENEWGQGKDVSTEDLRQALRRYRSFFDRLLSV
jgi:hypothetical protein